MEIVPFLIQVAALVCLFFAALGFFPGKISWGWAGMFLWLASLMLSVAVHPVNR